MTEIEDSFYGELSELKEPTADELGQPITGWNGVVDKDMLALTGDNGLRKLGEGRSILVVGGMATRALID
jgi:hypothetical protein